MNQKKKKSQSSTDTPAPTPGVNSAGSMTSKQLEELKYDTAVAMLKSMSPGSVFQFAVDRQLQLLDLYEPEELVNLCNQYKMYDPATKKQKTSRGGFSKDKKIDDKLGYDTSSK